VRENVWGQRLQQRERLCLVGIRLRHRLLTWEEAVTPLIPHVLDPKLPASVVDSLHLFRCDSNPSFCGANGSKASLPFPLLQVWASLNRRKSQRTMLVDTGSLLSVAIIMCKPNNYVHGVGRFLNKQSCEITPPGPTVVVIAWKREKNTTPRFPGDDSGV
jgi:hypothetical protein